MSYIMLESRVDPADVDTAEDTSDKDCPEPKYDASDEDSLADPDVKRARYDDKLGDGDVKRASDEDELGDPDIQRARDDDKLGDEDDPHDENYASDEDELGDPDVQRARYDHKLGDGVDPHDENYAGNEDELGVLDVQRASDENELGDEDDPRDEKCAGNEHEPGDEDELRDEEVPGDGTSFSEDSEADQTSSLVKRLPAKENKKIGIEATFEHGFASEEISDVDIFAGEENLHELSLNSLDSEENPDKVTFVGKTASKFEESLTTSENFTLDENVTVKCLLGQELTVALFQKEGFARPILVRDQDGLGLKVPVFGVEQILIHAGSARSLEVMEGDVSNQKKIQMMPKEFNEYWTTPPESRTQMLNFSMEFSNTKLDPLVILI